MVAPIAAKMAPKLATAVRSFGGKAMHSSSGEMRSLGSKVLKVTDEKAVKALDTSLRFFSKINAGVGKILSTFAQHSPALKQQLIILGKAFSVMMRPIGDLLAKFLRPMAVMFMKFAQRWFALFGDGSSGMDDPKDKEKAAKEQLESLQAAGAPPEQIAAAQANVDKFSQRDTGDVGFMDGILNALDGFKTKLSDAFSETTLGKLTEGINGFMAKMWTNFLPDAVKESLNSIVNSAKALWQVLKDLWAVLEPYILPVLKAIAFVVGGVLWAALKAITYLFDGLTNALQLVSAMLKLVSIWFNIGKLAIAKVVDYIKDFLIKHFSAVWEILKKIGTYIKDTFLGVLEKLKSVFSTVAEWISKKVEKIQAFLDEIGLGGKKDEEEELAVGGTIDRTGLYRLHAGERILTAGDNARQSAGTVNVTNQITIQATINNDLDIRELARKLASYNETELRRRVSYF